MKRDDIIESGILEQYLLGELDASKQLEVENALNSDSKLKIYFYSLESTFEDLGNDHAINPPKHIKTDLLKSIQITSTENLIKSDKTGFTSKTLFSIAASIAALLLVGILWMFTELNNTKQQLQLVEEQNQSLLKDLNSVTNNFEATSKWLEIINSPDAKQYVLDGNSLSPTSKVISYVNNSSKSVIINTEKLAKLDNTKDYQMWADVEGEMINMGIIDTSKALLAMTYIDNAESLNITIEPKGGNDHPTVSNLISNVYLEP